MALSNLVPMQKRRNLSLITSICHRIHLSSCLSFKYSLWFSYSNSVMCIAVRLSLALLWPTNLSLEHHFLLTFSELCKKWFYGYITCTSWKWRWKVHKYIVRINRIWHRTMYVLLILLTTVTWNFKIYLFGSINLNFRDQNYCFQTMFI